MLLLTTPHRSTALAATPENIRSILEDLVGRTDPFVILAGDDELTYMQTLWTPNGFHLEFQAGSVERHYRATREDLTAAEVAAAFDAYARGDESGWLYAFFYRQVEVRTAGYLSGLRAGQLTRRWGWVALLIVFVLLSVWLLGRW